MPCGADSCSDVGAVFPTRAGGMGDLDQDFVSAVCFCVCSTLDHLEGGNWRKQKVRNERCKQCCVSKLLIKKPFLFVIWCINMIIWSYFGVCGWEQTTQNQLGIFFYQQTILLKCPWAKCSYSLDRPDPWPRCQHGNREVSCSASYV